MSNLTPVVVDELRVFAPSLDGATRTGVSTMASTMAPRPALGALPPLRATRSRSLVPGSLSIRAST